MQLVRKVRQYVERHGLLSAGDGIVVGVSGGPDSLCLLHILCQLRAEFDLKLHAAHLHHNLRGEEADADAVHTEAVAAEWGVASTVERADVPQLAERGKLSLEEAARQARYAFLSRVAVRLGARSVAVAHNADDQAETVLMHFLRGTGLAGLRGMRPQTPMAELRIANGEFAIPNSQLWLVRPLLDTPRTEIEAYCAENGLQPRFDRSNLDTTIFRNRLRHELLPELEKYNPNIRGLMRRAAEVAAGDYATLEMMLATAWRLAVLDSGPDQVIIDLEAWRSLSVGLRRGLVRMAVTWLQPHLRDVDYVPVEAAVRLADNGHVGERATLPGDLVLRLGYSSFEIASADKEPRLPDSPFLTGLDPIPMMVPGRTALPGQAWQLVAQVTFLDAASAEQRFHRVKASMRGEPWSANLDAARVPGRLSLRPRRPGDRFQPQGMGGERLKLSDFMINAKLPVEWRAGWPLVAADDEVLWVCGYRVAEAAAVSAETRTWLELRWERERG